MITETVAGIEYQKPKVNLLHASPLVNAEIAGRTAYDSFNNSEHKQIQTFNGSAVEEIEDSELMMQLCHVYFHTSVIEHINLTYHLSGISRGVLQELVRHRIASYTVRSTRYTMSDILYAFIASWQEVDSLSWFKNKLQSFDMFVVNGLAEELEIAQLYVKLGHQKYALGNYEFIPLCLSKSNQELYKTIGHMSADTLFEKFKANKTKRNVGDSFKWVVTDNFKVDLVVTFNLRSLKNYFDLRDSGSAWAQIRWLSQEMKKATPKKYLKLIDKKFKND